MLRTIPKHKGTEHLQADIKTRIKELTEELGGPRKGGGRGAARSSSSGPRARPRWRSSGRPTPGKSSLHARLTGSHAVVGPYPFATKFPLARDAARTRTSSSSSSTCRRSAADYIEPWMGGTLQNADAVLLVVGPLGSRLCRPARGAWSGD